MLRRLVGVGVPACVHRVIIDRDSGLVKDS